ncbi:PucR family transcriptional regulator [Rossellomorea aquimaris]|uniref:PucR family transcriptional regulator n=1 Tax=Rossellomorea aquimaris TaxID=189382 RepID=UPI0007D04AA1|nr:helix-turn-helix domain-containing protein [Rossellomorea aquimaris]
MFSSLQLKYPEAIIQKHYPTALSTSKIWFANNDEDEYIGIERDDLTREERQLLQCLFKEITTLTGLLSDSPISNEWFSYLFENGPAPSVDGTEYRIIQVKIREELDFQSLKEAFQHLLPLHAILIFQNEQSGLIIEEKGDWNLDEEQLHSISHVIESDFFSSLSFFIGQFHSLQSHLPSSFQYEREMFAFSATIHYAFIQSAVTVLPFFALHHLPHQWKNHIFSKIAEVFEDDHDLITTVKAFLENQSNISQTAKRLFMHRNSVQYRIDKFIEKTNIDIRTFQGAILAYLACLHFQSDNLPKKDS